MKIKKKKYKKLIEQMIIYECALEDIIYVQAPELDGDAVRHYQWLARKRRDIAEEVLKKGYEYEFGNNDK